MTRLVRHAISMTCTHVKMSLCVYVCESERERVRVREIGDDYNYDELPLTVTFPFVGRWASRERR